MATLKNLQLKCVLERVSAASNSILLLLVCARTQYIISLAVYLEQMQNMANLI